VFCLLLSKLPSRFATLALVFASACVAINVQALTAESSHEKAISEIIKQLESRHYVKLDVNDDFSEKLLDAYLTDLDPNRQHFLQSDIDDFQKYRDQLDNQLKDGKLSAGFIIFDRYLERITTQLEKTIAEMPKLVKGFDFKKDEVIVLERSESPWPKSRKAADEIWHKQVKNRVLSLKLADKDDDEIIELLTKRFKNQLKRLNQIEAEDVFQSYANAVGSLYDPHTDYFSPRGSENFQINMSLKLEGIGAVLQMEDDYTKIVRLVAAGPADKQGELHPSDRIVGVAEGEKGEMQDVIGWRLDDVVDLIRGPAGSIVRLEVIPAVAQSEEERTEIVIERNEVKLEEQSAKGEIIELTDENKETRKIGVIDVPAFYLDFEAFRMGDLNYRSTTRDVSEILEDLLNKGAEGIVIDLRNNGGGSLAEANALVGLFIESGPTVQIRHSSARVIREGKRRSSPYYSGPLGVLINRMSASASEIFAGAIQDYQRGIVLGTQSFGKGTVQSVNPLSHGQLKLTESKFYRVSGDSTQNRGVIPDIAFPPIYDKDEIGESILDNAMTWDRIASARHNYYFDLKSALPKLQSKHDKRIAKDPEFIFLQEQISLIEELRNRKTLSLNMETRKTEREEQKALRLAMENRRRIAKGEEPLEKLEEDEEKSDELAMAEDGVEQEVNNDETADEDKEDKDPDPMAVEASHILVDAIPFFKPERLAKGS
jgi:carboxyl-terminal processing protease